MFSSLPLISFVRMYVVTVLLGEDNQVPYLYHCVMPHWPLATFLILKLALAQIDKAILVFRRFGLTLHMFLSLYSKFPRVCIKMSSSQKTCSLARYFVLYASLCILVGAFVSQVLKGQIEIVKLLSLTSVAFFITFFLSFWFFHFSFLFYQYILNIQNHKNFYPYMLYLASFSRPHAFL